MGRGTRKTKQLTIKRVAGWREDPRVRGRAWPEVPGSYGARRARRGTGCALGHLVCAAGNGGPRLLELRVPFLAQVPTANDGDKTSKAVAALDRSLMCLYFKLPLVTYCRDEDDGDVRLKVGQLSDDPMSRDALRSLLGIHRAAPALSRPMIDAWREAMVKPACDSPGEETAVPS